MRQRYRSVLRGLVISGCAAGLGWSMAAMEETAQATCPADCSAMLPSEPLDPLPGLFYREPVAIINTWNGSWSDNALGLHSDWYDDDDIDPNKTPLDADDDDIPDVFNWLINQLDDRYNRGYRRIALFVPAGRLDGFYYPMSQWYTMPRWKRQGFRKYIGASAFPTTSSTKWLDQHPDAELIIYCGSRVMHERNTSERPPFNNLDPCEWMQPSGGKTDTVEMYMHLPDLEDEDDMCYVYSCIKPWENIGITSLWFDAWNDPDLIALQRDPNYAGSMKLGGEAIPRDDTDIPDQTDYGCNSNPDVTLTDQFPFVMWWNVGESRFPDEIEFPVQFDASKEIGLALSRHGYPNGNDPAYGNCGGSENGNSSHHDRWKYDDAYRWHERGTVLWAGDPYRQTLEAIQRIYGFGPLNVVANFNNDFNEAYYWNTLQYEEYVNGNDVRLYDQHYAQFNENADPPPVLPTHVEKTYYHGDMDGDHDVDVVDRRIFDYFYFRTRQFMDGGGEHPSLAFDYTIPTAPTTFDQLWRYDLKEESPVVVVAGTVDGSPDDDALAYAEDEATNSDTVLTVDSISVGGFYNAALIDVDFDTSTSDTSDEDLLVIVEMELDAASTASEIDLVVWLMDYSLGILEQSAIQSVTKNGMQRFEIAFDGLGRDFIDANGFVHVEIDLKDDAFFHPGAFTVHIDHVGVVEDPDAP